MIESVNISNIKASHVLLIWNKWLNKWLHKKWNSVPFFSEVPKSANSLQTEFKTMLTSKWREKSEKEKKNKEEIIFNRTRVDF